MHPSPFLSPSFFRHIPNPFVSLYPTTTNRSSLSSRRRGAKSHSYDVTPLNRLHSPFGRDESTLERNRSALENTFSSRSTLDKVATLLRVLLNSNVKLKSYLYAFYMCVGGRMKSKNVARFISAAHKCLLSFPIGVASPLRRTGIIVGQLWHICTIQFASRGCRNSVPRPDDSRSFAGRGNDVTDYLRRERDKARGEAGREKERAHLCTYGSFARTHSDETHDD